MPDELEPDDVLDWAGCTAVLLEPDEPNCVPEPLLWDAAMLFEPEPTPLSAAGCSVSAGVAVASALAEAVGSADGEAEAFAFVSVDDLVFRPDADFDTAATAVA